MLSLARTIDQQLIDARRTQRGAEHRIAVLLAEMADGALHRTLGYASVEQYAAGRLELTTRMTREFVRIGRAIAELPVLNAALAEGVVDWTKAREVVRVATPATESAWTRRAKMQTARVIEKEVAAARIGDAPPSGESVPALGPARRRLVFECEATDAEAVLQALALLRARTDLSPVEIDDGALLAEMARAVITQGEVAASGERYRVVLQTCPRCEQFSAPDAEVSDTVAAEASCDAEVVDMRPGPREGHATRAIPPVLRRKVLHRAGWRCEVPECRNRLWLDVHHTEPWADAKRHDFEKLLVLCSSHHRAVHLGYLAVEARRDGRVAVEHGDGRRVVGSGRRGTEMAVAGSRPGFGNPEAMPG